MDRVHKNGRPPRFVGLGWALSVGSSVHRSPHVLSAFLYMYVCMYEYVCILMCVLCEPEGLNLIMSYWIASWLDQTCMSYLFNHCIHSFSKKNKCNPKSNFLSTLCKFTLRFWFRRHIHPGLDNTSTWLFHIKWSAQYYIKVTKSLRIQTHMPKYIIRSKVPVKQNEGWEKATRSWTMAPRVTCILY